MKKRRVQTRPRRYIYRQSVVEKIAHPQKSAFERKVSILANLSQAGLLLLAIIGYFYTVRPIYTKALLDEEMAKTKIELRTTEKKIKENNLQLVSLKEESKQLREQAEQLRSGLQSQTEKTRAASRQADNLKYDLLEQYYELLPRLLNEFEGIALSLCHKKHANANSFSTCIEKQVLPSGNLYALKPSDRRLILRLSRVESQKLPTTWTSVTSALDAKEKEIQDRLNTVELACKGLESNQKNDRDLIDKKYKCRMDASGISTELLMAQFERASEERKITSSALRRITSNFYSK